MSYQGWKGDTQVVFLRKFFHWGQPDKDADRFGFGLGLVEAIPDFSGALTRAEAQWQARKYNEAAARKWEMG